MSGKHEVELLRVGKVVSGVRTLDLEFLEDLLHLDLVVGLSVVQDGFELGDLVSGKVLAFFELLFDDLDRKIRDCLQGSGRSGGGGLYFLKVSGGVGDTF